MHIEKIISPPVVPHFFFNLMTNALLISCGAHQIVDKFCIFDYLLIIGGQTYFDKGHIGVFVENLRFYPIVIQGDT